VSEAYAHPHDLRAGVPDRLPIEVVRELSRLEPALAVRAIAGEWAAIVAAIVICERVGWPWLYPLAVVWIGARQAALTVIAHDAAVLGGVDLVLRLVDGRVVLDSQGRH
jgi:fatty acid desaturase